MGTMGNLTGYLQDKFREACPPGWDCQPETRLLTRELQAVLGYAPRADVVLTECAAGRRLWIEFEVSRADPVANHAKFATAHLFQPQPPNDIFVSMVSRHVERGRRNLAANTIQLMRHIGMQAVQTVLFLSLNGGEVQRFNQICTFRDFLTKSYTTLKGFYLATAERGPEALAWRCAAPRENGRLGERPRPAGRLKRPGPGAARPAPASAPGRGGRPEPRRFPAAAPAAATPSACPRAKPGGPGRPTGIGCGPPPLPPASPTPRPPPRCTSSRTG